MSKKRYFSARELALQEWDQMVANVRWIKGYPEIALLMLLRVVGNRRTCKNITHNKADPELQKMDKFISARERLEIRMSVLRNELFFAKTKKEKDSITAKINYINQRLRKLDYDERVRKNPDYQERHKKYMIEYRKRKKEEGGK